MDSPCPALDPHFCRHHLGRHNPLLHRLDAQFTELESGKEKGAGKSDAGVWMVHSGGFYLIDKQKRPQLMPQVLHWFKWNQRSQVQRHPAVRHALLPRAMMTDFEDAKISNGAAVGISVGLLLVGWAVYDFLGARHSRRMNSSASSFHFC